MSSFEHHPSPKPQIETIKTKEGNEISFSAMRGSIITSLKFNEKEILYFNKESFENTEDNVRGGIPILFPNAGGVEGPKYPNLKQHGFARDMKWISNKMQNGFISILESNKESKEMFSYEFYTKIRAEFKDDGSFEINQSVKNLEKEKELPISMGLHPYFKVPSELKKDIEFNFKGGDFIKENIKKWSNGEYISIDNPKGKMEINIPTIGKIILNVSKEYEKIWVWSKKGEDFFCIEPVMRDKNGLVNNPHKIKPADTFSAGFNISFKED